MFLPETRQVWVVHPAHQTALPMRRVHPAGLYETICPWQSDEQQRRYQLRVSDKHGEMKTIEDPYAFPSLFSDYDLYLLGEGKHYRAYERLGAHRRTVGGVSGVNFAVWAPNAVSVSVVGDFNHWDDRRNFLRHHCANGIWELFVPGIGVGDLYKYRIKTRDGQMLEKADPYAFGAEVPPQSASVVRDLGHYVWNDDAGSSGGARRASSISRSRSTKSTWAAGSDPRARGWDTASWLIGWSTTAAG